MTLHLGVVDFSYGDAPGVTTGQVAQYLENKYGVMMAFYLRNEAFVAAQLEDSLAGALESVLMGAPPSNDAFGKATSAIKTKFDIFLSTGEAEQLGIAGVPTAAALKGVQTGTKSKTGAPRPSFVDTGLYRSSFISWLDTSMS